MATTGDIKNNLRKLQGELKLIQFTEEVDFEKMIIGLSAPFLPILHYVFTEYSCDLSSYFSIKGYDLYAKSDFRFLEIIYKILVQEFETKPMLTKQQFFSIGYSEIKVIFTTKIVSLCRQKNESLTKKFVKKKKRTTLPTKTCNNEYKQDDPCTDASKQNLGSGPSTITTEHAQENVSENECNIHQTSVHTKHHIVPPLPNPELALTPVKSTKEQSTNCHKNVDNREIHSDLLDLTDIGEESFMEINDVEVIETNYEVNTRLPQFTITKHSDVGGRHLKVKANNWMLSNIIGSEDHFESYGQSSVNVSKQSNDSSHSSGHSLPGNISVALSKQSKTQTQQCQQCEQCLTNCDVIKMLVEKVGVMEKHISNLVNVNNDLSAKVVLVETKLKLMECSGSKRNEKSGNGNYALDEREQLHNVPNALSEYTSIDNGNNDWHELQDNTCRPPNDYVYTNVVTTTTATVSTSVEKSYSPIKYTDDDIIIKDFKPIRMKDVYNMMNEVVLEENKENDAPSQVKKIKERKEVLKIKIIDDSPSEDPTNEKRSRDNEVGDIFSDSCDVSMLFDDDVTEQAVQNVRKRLQETENMLRNSGSYVVK